MNERKQHLEFKLSANRQRLSRQDYLVKLSPVLRDYLSECDFIQSPEFDKLLPLFWIRSDGIGTEIYKPENYLFREFSRENKLFAELQKISDEFDEAQSLFYPFLDNPIYRVKFGWVRQNLVELFTYSPYCLGVVTANSETGLVIDNYCGYLENDINGDEVVYELATWGF
jgi:hypothetical protein